MTDWLVIPLGLYAALVLIAGLRHIIFSLEMKKTPWLGTHDPQANPEAGPLVSVIIPAKDEEHCIERCIRSLLDQEYHNIEIFVVDDRSEDRTAEIVKGLTKSNPKVHLVQIEELPEGWTGKTHALHVCQTQARGEWLLFVDADTTHHPQCLGTLLEDALIHKSDMQSLLPAMESHSFWEKVVQPFAGVCLMVLYPLSKVNDPNQESMGFANGQFILVRRTAYDQIGGHVAVRDKFVEDIHLGRLIRKEGLNLRVVMAPDLSAVRMYAGLSSLIKGWSRILYSAVDAKPLKLYLLFISICLFSILSYVMIGVFGILLLTGTTCSITKSAFVLGIIHEFFQTTLMARIYRTSRSDLRYLTVRPLAVFVMLYILVVTIRMCSTHEVTWRGTAYGAELKQ